MQKPAYLGGVVLAIALGAATDFARLGPAVGEPMPDFSAPDQDGKVHSLKSLLKPKGATTAPTTTPSKSATPKEGADAASDAPK